MKKKKFSYFLILVLFFSVAKIHSSYFSHQNNVRSIDNQFLSLSRTDNESINYAWTKTWGGIGYYTDVFGSRRSDYGHEVAVDSNNDIYLVGETGSYGNGKSDFCLVKYNEEGTQLWNRTWGGSRYDAAMDVAIDSNDNVYIAGSYHYYVAGESQGGDMAVVKYNSSGYKIWERTFGGSNDDECNSLVIDSYDNIYLAGARDQDPSDDFLVVKYDSSGNRKWFRVFGGTYPDTCYDIAVDSKENVYLVGKTNNYGTRGYFNFLIVKYNKYGNQLWYRAWGGSSDDFAYDIVIDPSNNIYVAGESGNPQRITIVKFSSSGGYRWHRTWKGGAYMKDEYYDEGAITINENNLIYITSSSKTLWVYNTSGDLQWTLDYSVSGIDKCSGLSFDSHGNLYFGGRKRVIYYGLCLVKYQVKTPKIEILSPSPNDLFGNSSPGFELSIYEPQLNSTWYSLNGGVNYTFSESSGIINQDVWDSCDNGSVLIQFYANNSDGNTSVKEIIVEKDIIPPEIEIISPSPNDLFGLTSPNFEISIIESNLNRTWYSLNQGNNFTFTGTWGIINQEAWDVCQNGTVTITFFANDSVGNINHKAITVNKNDHVPEIEIVSPKQFDLYGNNPPNFELIINESDLNKTWYTLNGGTETYFTGFSGTIKKEVWENCENGSVIVRFYANNTAGNVGYEDVILKKDIISPEIIIISPSSNQLFGNTTIGFNLTINEPHLNSTWYSLNGGKNYTFSESSGIINQEAWDACENGTVLIQFYANDTLNHLSISEIIVRKDNIPPNWSVIPQDIYIEYGDDLNYQLDAYDSSGIESWGVNNTSFDISIEGMLKNIISLFLKTYYLEIRGYDPAENYCKVYIKIIVRDTSAPIWQEQPTDQVMEFGEDFFYDLNATCPSGIETWGINDTSSFQINGDGLIKNNVLLPVKIYWLKVRAYNPYLNYCQAIIMINVSDSLPPSWEESPTDQVINSSDSLYYDLNASDLSGIDSWWINDTIRFQIDENGIISNITYVLPGIYTIKINVNDTFGNEISTSIQIEFSEKSGLSDEEQNDDIGDEEEREDEEKGSENDKEKKDNLNLEDMPGLIPLIVTCVIMFSGIILWRRRKSRMIP